MSDPTYLFAWYVVCHLILDTHLEYHFVEVTVNVSANNNVLGVWK